MYVLLRSRAKENETYLWIEHICEHIKIEHICGLTVRNIINFFLFYLQVEVHQNKTKVWLPDFMLYKTFSKNQKSSYTSLPVSFSAWFFKKIFLMLYCIN